MKKSEKIVSVKKESKRKNKELFKKNYQYYLLILPGFIYYLVFFIGPAWGLSVAFFDYDAFKGLGESEFVLFDNFISFFQNEAFFRMLRNTLVISLMNLVFYFPAPIILAILLSELRCELFKKINQTIVYLPHFLSWVVISGLTVFLLSMDVGIVNKIIVSSGNEPMAFLTNPKIFWWVLLVQNIWKEIGWGSILFLAAISQINPQIYESATIDGANRLQKIIKITIPSIMPTVVVLFIIRMGKVLDVNFEQVLIMYNPSVRQVGEIFDTYAYKIGVQRAKFSIGATVGMFKSVISLILVLSSNKIIKFFGQEGIY